MKDLMDFCRDHKVGALGNPVIFCFDIKLHWNMLVCPFSPLQASCIYHLLDMGRRKL